MGESQNNPIAPYDRAITETAKVVNRFLEMVHDWASPWQIKRTARAEYERATLETAAKVERIIQVAEAESEIEQLKARTARRIVIEELRHQVNREAVVAEAIKYLPDSPPTDSINEDWLNSFFRDCEDISEPQMRTLFAKVIAGEFEEPGAFSRRTVGVVREMTARDIVLLEKACSLFWFLEMTPRGGPFIPGFIADNEFTNLLYSDQILDLIDAGILHGAVSVTPSAGSVLRYGSHRFRVGDSAHFGIPSITVSVPGQELFRAFDTREHESYLARSLMYFKLPSINLELLPLPD